MEKEETSKKSPCDIGYGEQEALLAFIEKYLSVLNAGYMAWLQITSASLS